MYYKINSILGNWHSKWLHFSISCLSLSRRSPKLLLVVMNCLFDSKALVEKLLVKLILALMTVVVDVTFEDALLCKEMSE